MTLAVLDTNIVLRLADPKSPEHPAILECLETLQDEGVEWALVPQVLIEFWVVATRPVEVNGFGWSTSTASLAVRGLLVRANPSDPPGIEGDRHAGKHPERARLRWIAREHGGGLPNDLHPALYPATSLPRSPPAANGRAHSVNFV